MSALTAIRNAPARTAAAVQSRQAEGPAAEAGMTTAEYAVGTVAACGFAGVLYKVITSDVVLSATASMASKRRRMRSDRQSLASSTAARCS